MSTPFTTPGDATWQTLLNEITTAYSERRQSLKQTTYTATDDKDVQLYTYWTILQSWLESNCLNFIDHVSGPLNPAGTSFLYFTLLSFRSAAGLNASGFRRVPEGVEWDGITDPVWSYGQMQAGDIIGPWIFEDLQNCFSVLQYVLYDGTLVGTKKDGGVNAGDVSEEHGQDLGWMKATSETLYAGCAPYSSSDFSVFSYIYHIWWHSTTSWDTSLRRINGNLNVAGIAEVAGITHTWELYLMVKGSTPPLHIWEFTTFGDFTYPPTDGVLSIVEKDDTPSSETHHEVAFGSLTQPTWVATPPASWWAYKGYLASDISFLIKWNFTNV